MKKKIIDVIEIVFKLVYVIHLFLAFNVYTCQSKYTLPIVLGISGILLLYRVIKIRDYIKYKNLMLLLMFLVSYVVTTLVNIKYGLFESFQYFIWLLLQVILLYTFSVKKEREQVYKEIKFLSFVIVIMIAIGNVISVGMLFAQYSSSTLAIDGSAHVVGISKWGRLFGIYPDPNYAGIMSIVAILVAIYLMRNIKNRILKVMCCAICIIDLLYIIFSGSRSSLISLILGICIYYIHVIITNQSYKKIKKIVFGIVGTILIIVSIYGIDKGAIALYNYSFNKSQNEATVQENKSNINNDASIEKAGIDEKDEEKENNNNKDANNTSTSTSVSKKNIQIGREEKISEDISNRRFDIWKSCMEIFKTSPIVGVGFRNLIPYAKDVLPNTYLVNNDYINFDASHNMIVDIIVSQGILGVVTFAGFAIATIIFVLKNLKKAIKNDKEIVVATITICFVLVFSSMFLSHILFVNNITTYMFWLYFGYLVYFLQDYKKNKED